MKSIRKFNKKRVEKKKKDSDLESVSSDGETEQNFWDKLKSYDKDERETASSFLTSSAHIDKLDLNSLHSVNTIVEQLSDTEPQIIYNILNGIQVFSQKEIFYQNLQKTNLMQKLKTILENSQSHFFTKDSIKMNIQIAVFELASQLSESTPIQYLQIWQDLFLIAIKLLQSTPDPALSESILDFFSILTESSEFYCSQLAKDESLITLLMSLSAKSQTLQGYTSFILYHIAFNLNVTTQVGSIVEQIVPFIHQMMSIHILEEIDNFRQIFNPEKQENNEKALQIWLSTSKAIQVSLGLLIRIFETDDGFEDFEDEASDDEMEQKQVVKEQLPLIQMTLQEKLNKPEFQRLVLDKLRYVSKQDLEFLEDNVEKVQANTKSINYLCLSYFSNIYQNLDLGLEMEMLGSIWNSVQKEEDADILLQALKLFYQSLQKSEIMEKTDQQQIFVTMDNLLKKQMEEEICLVCLDILAFRFQPKFNPDQQIIVTLTDLLIQLLGHQNMMVVAQALNALFDIFQEENLDAIFAQKNLMTILQKGSDLFKGMLQKMKGQPNYSFLRDCANNLKRFIQYKKEQGL